MPLEIRELVIRVAVNPEQGKQGASGDSASAEAGQANKDAIVAECVEQVLQIIHSKKVR